MATADISPSHSPGARAATPSGTVLQNRLTVLMRRRNAQQMSRALVRAAIPGFGLAAISVALYRFHIIPDGPIWAPAAMIGASLIWGARNGWLARRGHFVAASDADKTLDLDDRLSSALAFVAPDEIQHTQRVAASNTRLGKLKSVLLPRSAISHSVASPATNLVPALVGDATARAASLDPRRVYPFRFDRPAQVLTVCVALFVGSLFLPDAPLLMGAQQKQERVAIMKEGEKLVAVSKQIRKEEKPNEAEVAKLNSKLNKLGKKMARGRLTKRAALTEIGELKKKLQDAQKPNSQQNQSSGMPQIPEALRQAPLQSQVGRKVQQDLQDNKWEEAAKELDKLADRLDKGQVSKTEKQQIANDLDKLAKDLENRGGQANKEAAQKLKDAAQQLRQEPPKSPGQQPQTSPEQNQNGGQNQQQQQNGAQKPGQQGQKQNDQQQGKQGQQGQQGKTPQGQGKQSQQQGNQGKSPDGKTKQGQQQGSQGQTPQGQGKEGQQGSQGQSPQNQGQNKPGQQGGQGGQMGQGQQGQSGASGAMRDMANGLRQGQGGGSGNMSEMLDKLRQAENGANGQGNCPGGDCSGMKGGRTFGSKGEMGNMITPGKDLKPTDPYGMVGGGPGLGPRNNAQGVNSGGGVSTKKSRRTGDKRRYQDAWSDQLPGTQKKISKIKGKWGGSGEVEQLPTKGEAKGGQAQTPLYDTYQSYKKDAEDAVSREVVPPAYKGAVKDYFESIKP